MSQPTHQGSLVVVGTGIKAIAHLTAEARENIQSADKVLYLVADPVSERWIREANESAESLTVLYEEGVDRTIIYQRMADYILTLLRREIRVCVALYGHPGVFASPGRLALNQARAEGYPAEMLPGISAEACLIAELGVDPGVSGWQSYEATDFLLHPRSVDASSPLILWQVGIVGDLQYHVRQNGLPKRLRVLADLVAATYGQAHQVVLFEASRFPAIRSHIVWLPLRDMPDAEVLPTTTLYIPPSRPRRPFSPNFRAIGLPLARTKLMR
jgi:precorrin-6B methylase 1